MLWRFEIARAGRLAAGLVFALVATLALLGCNIAGPMGGELAATPVAAAPAKPAAPENSERKRLIDAFGGQYNSPAVESYLNEVLVKLAPASDAPTEIYHVTLLDSPIVNAFALPYRRHFRHPRPGGSRQ